MSNGGPVVARDRPSPQRLRDSGPMRAATASPAEPRLAHELHGNRLLLTDIRTGYLLINRARRLAIARLFGVGKDDEYILTLIAVILVAQAAHDQLQKLTKGAISPGGLDATFGFISFRELLCRVAGPASRNAPALGTLLAIAVLGGAVSPAIRKSARGVRNGAHRIDAAFHRRYGYLIDAGHRRERRAQLRLGRAPISASP